MLSRGITPVVGLGFGRVGEAQVKRSATSPGKPLYALEKGLSILLDDTYVDAIIEATTGGCRWHPAKMGVESSSPAQITSESRRSLRGGVASRANPLHQLSVELIAPAGALKRP